MKIEIDEKLLKDLERKIKKEKVFGVDMYTINDYPIQFGKKSLKSFERRLVEAALLSLLIENN